MILKAIKRSEDAQIQTVKVFLAKKEQELSALAERLEAKQTTDHNNRSDVIVELQQRIRRLSSDGLVVIQHATEFQDLYNQNRGKLKTAEEDVKSLQ